MRVRIAEDVLALFPEALVGVVRVRGCDNAGQSPEIAALLRRAEEGARAAFAGAAEPPVLLLGDVEARPPHPGEVIYRDDLSALCRRWNWKEADRTKLTAATRHAILVIEALPPTRRPELENALADLAGRITRHCGGEAGISVLDAGVTELEL